MESSNNQTTESTQIAQNFEKASWSTLNLLSIDLGQLMATITDQNSLSAEDTSYLSSALEKVKISKDHLRKSDFSHAYKFAEKAFRQVETLYELRKETNPDYQMVLAPFYYYMGNVITTYLEVC